MRGETAIAAAGTPVPTRPARPSRSRGPIPRALQAIERAELIVMGPGSLFTSTLPPLLVPGIREAVRAARAPRIYVCNLLQQPGETEGYRASDHVATDLRARRRRPGRRRAGEPQPGRARRAGAGRPRAACAGWASACSAPGWPASGSTTPTGWRGRWCASSRWRPRAMSVQPRTSATSWSSAPPPRACCRGAFLSGADPRTRGSLQVRGAGELAVVLELADPAAARLASRWSASAAPTARSSRFRERRFDRRNRVRLRHRTATAACSCCTRSGVLSSALTPLETRRRAACVGRACCRGAYLRGCFVAAGLGRRARGRPAHLELRGAGPGGAPRMLCAIAAEDGLDLRARPAARPRHRLRQAAGDDPRPAGRTSARRMPRCRFDEAEVIGAHPGAGQPADQLRPREPGAHQRRRPPPARGDRAARPRPAARRRCGRSPSCGCAPASSLAELAALPAAAPKSTVAAPDARMLAPSGQ